MAGDPRLGDNLTQEMGGLGATVQVALPWIDLDTANYVGRVITLLREMEPHFLAVIAFGSVARHEERPLDDPLPSDVDLLILLDPEPGQDELTYAQQLLLSTAAVHAWDVYPNPAREAQVVGALTHFHHWDQSFVENVARDGVLLWARGPLPAQLRPIEERLHAQGDALTL